MAGILCTLGVDRFAKAFPVVRSGVRLHCTFRERRGRVYILSPPVYLWQPASMARGLRVQYEGAVYHITSRGNARERIFFTRSDREAFLEIPAKGGERYRWICHAYCLMTSHDPC